MASSASINAIRTAGLGRKLECRRLKHRARRLELVIALLRERATDASFRSSPILPGHQHAITEFAAELSHIRDRSHGEHADDMTGRGKPGRKGCDRSRT